MVGRVYSLHTTDHCSTQWQRDVCAAAGLTVSASGGAKLWLTDLCDAALLRQALTPHWAGLWEVSAPLPEHMRSMMTEAPPDSQFLVLSTRSAHMLDVALPVSAAWRRAYPFQDDQAMDMELVIQEALANAILHGNLDLDSSWRAEANLRQFVQSQRERLDSPLYGARPLAILCRPLCDALSVTVMNDGDGFDWLHLAHPQRLLADRARGLSLIHRLSRTTHFEHQGRSITVELPFGP